MIKYVKLITGEEVIAKVEELDENTYIFRLPVKVNLFPTPPSEDKKGEVTIGLFPFGTIAVNHTLHVSKSNVIWVEDPVEELYNQYNKNFGSGLEIISKGGIIK